VILHQQHTKESKAGDIRRRPFFVRENQNSLRSFYVFMNIRKMFGVPAVTDETSREPDLIRCALP
jgi:hypothetical protein